MYAPTLDAPLSAYFASKADIPPFPLVPISGNQPDPSQTHTAISAEGSNNSWSIPQPVEGLVTVGHMHEVAYGNNGSQDVPELGLATGYPPVPFAVPALACGLPGGLHCTQPLDGSVKSIKLYLRMHGHKHPQRQTVQCPWMGCSRALQWMNIARHIQSTHLGIRFRCSKCGKGYTRLEGLARHTASLNCSGAVYTGA